MKLSTKGMAIACGILAGGAVFVVGILSLMIPEYGEDFLELFAGVYPGFEEEGGFVNVLIGTVYAAIDGVIFGFIFAWLYNRFSGD